MSIPSVSDPTRSLPMDPHDDETAIWAEDLSVRYRVPHERIASLKEFTIRWIQRRLQYADFWALEGVSFTLPRGEVLGIIGPNGAGKSTLLKVVARVLQPTRGRIRTRGSVAPLLELGPGFHPELTGRENVFLNSAMLGRPRSETQRLYEEIVDFAGLWDFIDAPLRTYSSGMVARLGFAVATCTVADILIIDEVLSVGDTQFREKCFDRIRSFQSHGASILLVSHNMTTIQNMCSQVIWLSQGRVRGFGPAEEVIQQYRDSAEVPAPS